MRLRLTGEDNMKIEILLVCAVVLAAGAPSFGGQSPGGTPAAEEGHRGDLLKEVEVAREAFESETDDAARHAYAQLLFESGSFEQARATVAPLVSSPEPSTDALRLAARLAFLMGDYGEAESLFLRLLERDPADARARSGLLFCCYQTNRFSRYAELSPEGGEEVRHPHATLMAAFGEKRPYEIEWTGPRAAELPFLSMDPLPIVEVEIDGRKVAALIDTGADLFILDTEVAEELGVEPVATMMGMFAGGKQAEIGFAETETLTLGSAKLRHVPISLLPTRALSLGEIEIGGIIGTGILKQFLSTVDYPRERLTLREREWDASSGLPEALVRSLVAEVPFYLEATHVILTHGSLNGYEGLLWHVDSGLAGEPSLAAPEQTLRYVGIPVPEVAVHEGVVGGGGGGFAVGQFDIATLGLGPLEQPDLAGSFGGQPPGSYRRFGFIMDGLISHNFLRRYAWTLDFDRMKMVFTR